MGKRNMEMIRFLLSSILRRICELVFSCIALSLFLALLCVTGILPDASVKMFAGVYIGVILFLCINIRMLRECHYEIRDNILYFIINFGANAVFALMNLLAYRLIPQFIYTFFFSITKFAKFTPFPVNSGYSAIIFHGIILVLIFLAPIGMRRIYEEEEEEFLENENLLPLETEQQAEEENANKETNQ